MKRCLLINVLITFNIISPEACGIIDSSVMFDAVFQEIDISVRRLSNLHIVYDFRSPVGC